MKKTLLFLSLVGALVSCKKSKTDDAAPTAAAQKIVITGKAFANTDLDNAAWENVPANTKVTAFVLLNDLRLKADTNLNGRFASFPAYVQADGTYTIQFAAPNKAIGVTLVYDDFAFDQHQPSGASSSFVRTTYKHSEQFMSVFGGTTKVDDAYWYF